MNNNKTEQYNNMKTTQEITDREIVEAMKKYGGSFVSSLADTYIKADESNRLIIKLAFSDYWENYLYLAKKDKIAK